MDEVDLAQIMTEDLVILDRRTFADKEELFDLMVPKLKGAGVIESEREFRKALDYRESLASTYMRNLIAMPHGKSETVKKTSICFCRCKQPFSYCSHGERGEVRYIFLLAIASHEGNDHYIRVLARLAGLLMYEEFIAVLDRAESYQDILLGVKRFQTET